MSSASTSQPRVLLIGADSLSEVLARALENHDFEPTVTDRGLLGLELARREEFDLVVLDLPLPDIDGGNVLARLIASRPNQQVLVVSASSDVKTKVICFELGAADYLCKPFALDEFIARSRARLGPSPAHDPGLTLGNGTLSLDSRRRNVTLADQTIQLSSREFLLLEYLMQHKGDVCSREAILESVWGYHHDPGTNVVDVYVRRLRRKIGAIHIETIRNVGYGLRQVVTQ